MGKFHFRDVVGSYDKNDLEKFITRILTLVPEAYHEKVAECIRTHDDGVTAYKILELRICAVDIYEMYGKVQLEIFDTTHDLYLHRQSKKYDGTGFFNDAPYKGLEYKPIVHIIFDQTEYFFSNGKDIDGIKYEEVNATFDSEYLDIDTLINLGVCQYNRGGSINNATVRKLDRALSKYQFVPFGLIIDRSPEKGYCIADLNQTIYNIQRYRATGKHAIDNSHALNYKWFDGDILSWMDKYKDDIKDMYPNARILLVDPEFNTTVYTLNVYCCIDIEKIDYKETWEEAINGHNN